MGRIAGDLKDRTFSFARSIVLLSDALPQNNKGWILGKQLIRAGTSVGANIREADYALTDADFASKCNTALKEASETQYGLDLCASVEVLSIKDVNSLSNEAEEFIRILSAIVKRTQDRSRNKP